jgi:polysaccharide pyruvyl transferase WcaK-like protein
MGDFRSIKKIGIFGHVGNRNLGDEAIITAVIQNMKRYYPGAEIYGFTLKPEDTRARHNIIAFPIRKSKKFHERQNQDENERVPFQKSTQKIRLRELVKNRLKSIPLIFGFLKGVRKSLLLIPDSIKEAGFFVSSYKNLKGIDLLIVAGSQQLIDFIGGPWGYPYTHFKWSIIAKSVKTKVAFLSVGAGPIQSPLSKFFIKYALSRASYQSYRDDNSKKLIEQIGVTVNNPVFPDLVYSLPLNGGKHTVLPGSSLPIVGINPIPFSDPEYWPGSSVCIYKSYVKQLAEFALWLVRNKHTILFFPTQLNLDPPVINDIKICMENIGGIDFKHSMIDQPIHSFDDLISAISMTSIVVASRFHGVVIPFVLNKPVLAIMYHKKTLDLMEMMGQSEYALNIHSFDCNSLRKRFVSLESNKKTVKREIERRASISRQALETQYVQLFNLLEKGGSRCR